MARAIADQGSPRYRIEGGRSCIDIRLKTPHQLFDTRDPAPFRERDLEEAAVEYIVGAFEDLPAKAEAKLVLWIAEPSAELEAETLKAAVRAHFAYEIERVQRRTRQQVRTGQLALGMGLAMLAAFLTLAELTVLLPEGTVRQILREGLVIIGWVAMWRPLDVLLYDWWPLVRQRRLLERIIATEIAVVPNDSLVGPLVTPAKAGA
jgi:hypothetical protein